MKRAASASNAGSRTTQPTAWAETYRRWLARQILLATLTRERAEFAGVVKYRQSIVKGAVDLADELIRQTA